jgi:hypothetical protein
MGKRNKTRKINNKKRGKRSRKICASMHKNKSGNKTPMKSPRKSPRKITYNVGDHVIMKPINVNMGGRSEGTIQHKNVRIDEIDGDNYIGTIFFPNGKQMPNYKFYLHEISSKIE